MDAPLSNGDIVFMDDITLSASTDSDEQLSAKPQVKLDKIARWALERGVLFNPRNFRALHNTVDTHLILHFRGNSLKLARRSKYLGVLPSMGHAMDNAYWTLDEHIRQMHSRIKSCNSTFSALLALD